MARRFEAFRDDLLVALMRAADRQRGYLDPEGVAEAARLRYPGGWVSEAVESLEAADLIRANYAMRMGGGPDSNISVTVTGKGWEAVERLLEERDSEIEKPSGEAPASDRYVRLDHNAPEYRAATSKLDELIEGVRGHNEYAASEPEDHEQRLAELESGRRLLEAVRVRLEPIKVVLLDALRYIAKKLAEHTVAAIATAAITAIAALVGLPP